jgi:hypothetical protein
MDENTGTAGRRIALVTGANKGIGFDVRGIGANMA